MSPTRHSPPLAQLGGTEIVEEVEVDVVVGNSTFNFQTSRRPISRPALVVFFAQTQTNCFLTVPVTWPRTLHKSPSLTFAIAKADDEAFTDLTVLINGSAINTMMNKRHDCFTVLLY
jgi:hypothetical protein